MGEEASQTFPDIKLKRMGSYEAWCNELVIKVEGNGNNEVCDSKSIESSIDENSEDSSISSISSSSDLAEDASSSSSSSSSATSPPNGPLYELSELMTQLPIKRGLSRHYQGKSQSFTSLASVKSLEDLPKKVNPYNNRGKMKACKSYGWGLDAAHNKSFSPKPTISKKGNSRSCFMSCSLGKRSLSTLVISE